MDSGYRIQVIESILWFLRAKVFAAAGNDLASAVFLTIASKHLAPFEIQINSS